MDSWLKAAVSEVQKSATQLAQDVIKAVDDGGRDFSFEKGPLGFTLDGPLVTALDKNHQAARLGVAVGDKLIAVEGYDVPECDGTDADKKRFKAEITRWIREAPRPVRLRFLSPPAVVEAVESVAEAQPSGSSAQAEAGLRGQAQTVAGGESDIGSTPREEEEVERTWLEGVATEDAAATGMTCTSDDPGQASGAQRGAAEQLKACERSLAMLRAELQISKETGRSMERELEELRRQHGHQTFPVEDTRLAQAEAELRSASEQLTVVRLELEDARSRAQEVHAQLAASRAECEALRSAEGVHEEMAREAFEGRENVLQDEVVRLRAALSAAEIQRHAGVEEGNRKVEALASRIGVLEKSIADKDDEATTLLRRAVDAEQASADLLVELDKVKETLMRDATTHEGQLHALHYRIAEQERREQSLVEELEEAKRSSQKRSVPFAAEGGLDVEAAGFDVVAARSSRETVDTSNEEVAALLDRVQFLERQNAMQQKKLDARPIICQSSPATGSSPGSLQPRGRPSWEAHAKTALGPRAAEGIVLAYMYTDRFLRSFTEKLLHSEAWLWLFYAHLVALYMVAGLTYAEVTPVIDPIESINARVDAEHT